ncbi:MAG: hypothetical protein K2L42_03170 [Clostridia bacterium]|nr:hypothetical protein [Clostridia bacterium]
MKSVLISIQPKWCERIASGKKTIEVRKTAPKLKTPFKCYIYCTGNKDAQYLVRKDGIIQNLYCYDVVKNNLGVLNCKVIGEFVCDGIVQIFENFYDLQRSCLSWEEIQAYAKGKPLYGWHISDLVIYDKPKELGEFKKGYSNETKGAWAADYSQYPVWLTRPPQSWCYVEV